MLPRTSLAIIVTLVTLSPLYGGGKIYKKYLVKSGKVTYTITGSGNIMGAMQKLKGKKRLIFDKYGFRELNEEVTVSKMNIFGNEKVDKSHRMILLDGTKAMQADFNHKKIMEMNVPGMGLMIAAANQNIAKMGEKMLKQMGGHKVGQETVAGYPCDVWKMRVATQCIYKGVPLKITTNILGIQRTEVATEAKFDIAIPESSFRLPDFPRQKLPTGAGGMSSEQTQQMIRQLQQKHTAFETAKRQQGVTPGAPMNADQQNKVFEAMGNAMLPQMKQRILHQEQTVAFAKRCFGAANTLKAANRCVDKGNQMFPQDHEDHLSSWSAADKQKMLGEIRQFEASIPCIKKAQSMEAIQQCMPR